MHAFLSDRELSIHSHHLGLLVKLTERFCNQSVTVKHIHTPIRPMIEKRVVLEFHLEFCVKVSYLFITLYGAFMFSRTKAKQSLHICAILAITLMNLIFSPLTLTT